MTGKVGRSQWTASGNGRITALDYLGSAATLDNLSDYDASAVSELAARTKRPRMPELDLLTHILLYAVADIQRYRGDRSANAQRIYQDAATWLCDTQSTHVPTSCRYICEVLGLDQAALIKAVHPDDVSPLRLPRSRGRMVPVRIAGVDRIFRSVLEAAKYLGVASSTVSQAIHSDWAVRGQRVEVVE